MKIITIIPAYNEEATIKDVVHQAVNYSDVLVVDDGSSDHTADLAGEAGARLIKHENNQGKGAAIKTGLKKAIGDGYPVIVLMDGDGQHNPQCIPHLASGLKKAVMVVCTRFKHNHPPGMTLQRRISNRLTTDILKLVTGYRITDSQCGFRAIASDVAPVFLNIPYNDYIYESEMLYQASKNKMIVKEKSVPCVYEGEKSYINWKNILNYILYILKLISRYLKRRTKH